ncbi:MAG: hypothetical protein A2W23_06010 [Planctomycetes bacterium RBG_16_43_13]|nr:MAG: hypothetical protein A2W23_06010 [Planctomycetes bacterium RBG_16_43_13]
MTPLENKEPRIVLQYDLDIKGPPEEVDKQARMALSNLFLSMAKRLEKNYPEDSLEFAYNTITLILEQSGWNQRFVLKLHRIDKE